ncbi:hypothetical protein pmac_cds_334 [Pandoravirus macleodensis]|uniref:Uncharacterized protein n=1 Tax=Pandoravirus macleodensis TaxID=2107707 RepID=A0A2U7UF43_9VIRU|nr:hypothetical protein pmac_cds_334 [Pandoravirus macleodensis]AVK77022.1 hypothetical protein pmac_cds_334 [Pandoravirus macleodensis]
MGRNRKRVGGRAAKRGDAGGKGDLAQAHTPASMQTPHDDTAAGPETSGFFDVSTLTTISMSGNHVSDALPRAAPLATGSTVVVDAAANNDHHDGNAETASGPSATNSADDVTATNDGNGHSGDGAQDETTIEDRGVVPADVPPVQRAYDLFARLRVWSAASASAERSVIVDDPSALDEPTADDPHRDSSRGDGSNVEQHPQRDTKPSDERLTGSDNEAAAPSADAALDSHTVDRPNAESNSPVNDPRSGASLSNEPNQEDGAETDGSVAPVDTIALVDVCARTEADAVSQHTLDGSTNDGENKNVESNSGNDPGRADVLYSMPECTNETITTTTTTSTTDAAHAAPCLTDRHGVGTSPQEATNNAQTIAARPNSRRRTATEATYGTWTPVDEPGWTEGAVGTLDAHASRVIAGKPSPRIVVFAHGAAPSALAAVRRFGPDAIVWVVSSAPDARNIERHGCSVVRWPARTAAVSADNLCVRDLVTAIPWDRVDVVVDMGTGRSPGQRAHILANIVPRMRGGGIYACAVDCRQAALELLRTGAAAIIHEHDHIVVVESTRVHDTRP